MKNLLNSIVVTLIFVLFNSLQAQDQYTIIHKNLNSTASGLHHNLNKSGDTIVMTSDKSILRVSFLSHEQKETVMIDLDNKVAKIPLYHLPIGRYTIAVYREDMIIAYDIVRKLPIQTVANATTDLEESIWDSSLDDTEKVKRNFKPKHKKNNSRLANTSTDKEANKSISEKNNLLEKERALAKANWEKAREEEEANKKASRIALAKQKEEARQKALKEVEAQRLAEAQKNALKKEEERKIAEAKRKAIEAAKKRILADIAEKKELEKQKFVLENSKKEQSKNTRDDKAVAQVDRSKAVSVTPEVKAKEVKYNLSVINDDSVNRQSREDYRKQNLRPNGKPYED